MTIHLLLRQDSINNSGMELPQVPRMYVQAQMGRPDLLLQAAQLSISRLRSQLRSRSHDMEGPAAASTRFHS